jgi:hypothetical protein
MTHYAIKHTLTGATLFEGDFDTMRLCVEAARSKNANLGGANLGGAYLGGANLCGANLNGANLGGANLGGAYLRDAHLGGAYLRGAYLKGANLRDTNLNGANLGGANLNGANLRGAYLKGGIKLSAFVKTCSRSDDYDFLLWDCEDRVWRLTAGCRFFTMEQAWEHWTKTRDNTPLGKETFDILVMFEHHIERIEQERRA